MTVPGAKSGRVAALLIAAYFLVFAGPGAIQGFLKNVLPAWGPVKVTSILAAVYFSFMFWRMLVVSTQRILGDRLSFAAGLASYSLMPAYLLAIIAFRLQPDYWALIVIALAWGWGSASLWQTGPVWLYDVTASNRRGLWAGVLYMLVFLGLIIGARLQGYAASTGDATLLLILALTPGALAVIFATLLPARQARSERLSFDAIKSVLSDRRVMLLGLLLFISSTAYGLLLGVFRDRIQEAFGASAVGVVLSYYFATRLVISVSGGHSSDLLARRTVVAAAFFVGGAALSLASVREDMTSLLGAAVCLGLVSGVVPVSATAFAADWFAAERRSLALGAAFLWQDCGMVISLLAGQYLVQATNGFRVPLMMFSFLFLVAAALTFVLPQGAPAPEPAAEVRN